MDLSYKQQCKADIANIVNNMKGWDLGYSMYFNLHILIDKINRYE